MTDLVRIGGPVACLGLALLLVARSRRDRIAGFGFALLGTVVMAAALAPHSPWKDIAEVVVAVAIGVALAAAFRILPWLLPLAALATVPIRFGALGHQLLVPLYLVILGGTVLFAWQLIRGDERSRELGPRRGRSRSTSAGPGCRSPGRGDVNAGAIEVLAFYIPFTLLALVVARLPWNELWLNALYVELGVMALIFAAVGFYQYDTRNVFENPKVINSNAYASYFRVNSVFWDPSIYGRFLVVAIIPSVVLIVRGRSLRLALGRGGRGAGHVARAAHLVLAVELLRAARRRRRHRHRRLEAGGPRSRSRSSRWCSPASPSAQPQIRRSIVHHTHSGLNSATSGRASLVANGIRIAAAHPVIGVGVGGFKHAYAQRLHLRGKAPKVAASHDAPVTVAAETGLIGLALAAWLALGGAARRVPPARPELPRTRLTRLRTRDCCDPVPLALLQRLLRGPDDLDAVRLRRAGGGSGRREREGGAGVIEHWRKALVLAPHTDDGEFGCGGTMARLAEAGCEVRYVAFSIATRSLPEGFPPDTLAREVREATTELGIPEDRLTVHDFDVRTFPEHRQDILELLVALWEEWQPDVVFQPSLHDIHQDHQTIAEEGLRAFKRTTILGYEIPWNNFEFSYQWYVVARAAPHRAQGRRARALRVAAAPPLRGSRVRLQPRAHARDQREPRVRRGVPGVPRDRVARADPVGSGAV